MATLDPTPYPVPEIDFDDFQAYGKACDELLDKLADRLWTASVADGQAVYYVKSWSPFVLQHVPVYDAYRVPPAYIRGLRASEVKEQLEADKRLRARFTKTVK